MRLSQEAIQRMINGRSGGGGGGGSFDPSELAGYATQAWTEENYISKTFFNELFIVHKKVTTVVMDGETEISRTVTTNSIFAPNEIPGTTTETDEETGYVTTVTTEISSIESKKGFWTNYFISALGLNGEGGGGGGLTLNEPLATINVSGLANHPSSSGQTIVWNGSAWVYGTAGGGTGTVTGVKVGDITYSPVNGIVSIPEYPTSLAWSAITSKPTTIAGYGITDAKIENGVITLGSNSITPLTASAISDMATKTWVGNNYLPLTGGTLSISGIGGFTVKNMASNYPLIRFEGNASGGIGFIGIGKNGDYVNPYYVTADSNGGYTEGESQWNILLHAGNYTNYTYSKSYIDTELAKKLDVAFFDALFQAYAGSTKVIPNASTSSVDNIKAMFGFWTQQYISALGKNDSQGVVSALSDLSDVTITSPSNGQALIYDGGIWKNGAAGMNMSELTTYLSSKILTVKNGTATLGTWNPTAAGTIDIASAVSGYVTALGTNGDYLTWTKNGTANNLTVPYATHATRLAQSDLANDGDLSQFTHATDLIYAAKGGGNTVTDKPTGVDAFGVLSFKTAAGYNGQILLDAGGALYVRSSNSLSGVAWKKILDSTNTYVTSGKGYINGTEITAISGNAATASRLADNTAKTAWGQTYWQNGQPKDVNGVFYLADGSNNNIYTAGILNQSSTSLLLFGYGTMAQHYNTYLYGEEIYFGTCGNGAASPSATYWTILHANGHMTIHANDITDTTKNIFLNVGGSTKTNRLYLSDTIYLEVANGGVHVVGGGLYADTYVSALGLSDSGSSAFDETAMWQALGTNITDKNIALAYIQTAADTRYALKTDIPTLSNLSWSYGNVTAASGNSYNGGAARSFVIPKATSHLTNDSGFITSSALGSYLPLTGGTINGSLAIRGISHQNFSISSSAETSGVKWTGVQFQHVVNDTNVAYGGIRMDEQNGSFFRYNSSYTTYKMWDAGNDGDGSGLDADLLDGQHASYFATAANLTTANGKITTLEGYFDGGVANSAKRLSGTSSYTAWGRTYWSSGVPQNVSGNIDVNTGEFLRLKDGTDYYRIIGIASDSTLLIGWDMRSQNRNTTLCTGKILNIGYGTNAYDTSYGKYWTHFCDNGHVTINTNDDTEVTRNIFLNIGGNTKTNRLYLHTDPNGDTTNDVYLVYENGGVHVVGGGLYTDTYVSALGLSDSGGSAFDETAMWQALGTTITEKQISSTYLTNALAPYALKTDIPTLKNLSWSYGSVTSASSNSYNGSTARSFVIPKNTSHLTNDSGFITSSSLDAYLPLTGGTLTGSLMINGTSHQNLAISSSAVTSNVAWTGLQFSHITDNTYVMYGGIRMNEQDGSFFRYNHNYTQYRIWDSGNDGSGSGLDADLIDGHDSTYFATATSLGNYLPLAGGTMTGSLKVATGIGISDASGNGLLVYHPTTWTGVTSSQWGVGAVDCQGVIRSSNTDLKHYRGGRLFNIVDNLYQEKSLSTEGWYRVADITGYGASLMLSISRSYNHGEPAPVTFIISHAYNYDTIIQVGGSARQSVAVTKVRLMRYAVGKIYIEIYYSRSDDNTVGVEITPLGHRLYNFVNLVDFTSVTSTSGLTEADYSPVSIGNVSGVTYTGSGGTQTPDYFGRSKVGFLMSNQTIHGDTSYKNWMYMDCYQGNDAGGTTAIGVSRTSGRMFVMQSDSNRTSFGTMREVVVANTNGSVNLSSSAGEVLILDSTNTYSCEVYRINDSSKWSVGANNSNAFYWYSITGGGTKMTLTSAGNLGVGTTSPSYKLDVNGAARVSELWIGNVRIIHDSTNGGLRVVSAGLYADTYLSALGVGDVGGGGGTDLETVWTSMAENNSSHTIHISHIQSALSSYLSSNNYITSSSINDMATKTWVGQQGYVTSTTLSGYATQQWVNSQNFATQSWVTEQGYVTSVAMSMPTGFTVTGSPITSSGTLAVSFGGSVTKNYVLASPSSAAGAPSWRALVAADIPNLDASKITSGTISSSRLPDLSGTYSSASRVTTLEGYFTSGSANTAVKLKTPRAINGTNFDGSAAITTTKWGTARNISIADADITNTGTAVSVDGSSAVTLKLPSTIKASLSGNATTATTASKLSTVSKTVWGQTYWTSGGVPTDVSGSIEAGNSGGYIGGFDHIDLNTHASLYGYGGYIDFYYNGANSYTSRIIEENSGLLALRSPNTLGLLVGGYNGDYVQIGQIRIVYDYSNNALKVMHSNGGAANLYAMGGISALGMIGNTSGEVAGNLVPSTDGAYELGSTTKGWSNLYLSNADDSTLNIYVDTGDAWYSCEGVHQFENPIKVSGTGYFSGKLSVAGTNSNSDKLYVNGSMRSSGISYASSHNNTSDARLKNIIGYEEVDVETIARAPLIKFTWKDGDSRVHIGTTAQYWLGTELHDVIEQNDYLSMDYATTALAGVISVARKVMTHEERIAALEAENERLRNEIETLKAA